jgi:murein L,D-transpeptidase YcbB/YkuD
MMAFSMPCYTNPLKFLLALLSMLTLLVSSAYADGINVNNTEIRLNDGAYQLRANFSINLNYAVQQALSHGVNIYFVSEFSVTRTRWYWLDEEVAQSQQSSKLSYNVLTRQYRISRGALFQNFPTLEEALLAIQRQNSSPIAADILAKRGGYVASARLRLDVEQLPKLLQVNALTGKDWDLDSSWYRWVLRPTDIGQSD